MAVDERDAVADLDQDRPERALPDVADHAFGGERERHLLAVVTADEDLGTRGEGGGHLYKYTVNGHRRKAEWSPGLASGRPAVARYDDRAVSMRTQR